MVVDFVVGRVLSGDPDDADTAAADRMDAPTAYYLLHRNDFGFDAAPAGACILYATACGLSDRDLDLTWDLIDHAGAGAVARPDSGSDPAVDQDPNAEDDAESASGSTLRLKTWAQRKHRSMGLEAPSGRPIPLIDRVHRSMQLWKAGDLQQLDDYLDDNGLRRHELFQRLIQSLIELADPATEERKLLESLSNHIRGKGATTESRQRGLGLDQAT